MRYENWDVLLFPEGSRIPLHEFKTQCYVTKDTESPYLQNPTILGPSPYFRSQASYGQIPVLTTFVPSLPRENPFRISIHRWEKPQPSRLLESMMQPDDVLLFEARVFIDGICVAGGVFGPRAPSPYVIDLSSNIDRDGNHDSLRFPHFHPEILEQEHWNAADTLGRIRVVIAEGFSRPNRSPPFERLKDVIIFSFQHAPLHVLEYSRIAWPNPHMWAPFTPQPYYNVGQNNVVDAKEPEDAHAHSPQKPDMRMVVRSMTPMASNTQSSNSEGPIAYNNVWASGRAFPNPSFQRFSTPAQTQARESLWAARQDRYPDPIVDSMDPFFADPAWRHRGARSSREDVPMPDYSSSNSRAISSTTGMSVSYEHSKASSIAAPMDDENYNLLVESLTPTKPPIGTRAPSNTPFTLAIMPAEKSTPATQIRKGSGHNQGSTLGLRELSQPSSRDVSVSAISAEEKAVSPPKVGASPSPNVKSRKETDKEKEKESVLDKENDSTVSTEL